MSAVTGGGAGLFWAETARRSGIRPSMATIMERALTCPQRLPRVISGFMLPISQRRARICSRLGLTHGEPGKAGRWSSAARPTASRGRRDGVGALLDELLLCGRLMLL